VFVRVTELCGWDCERSGCNLNEHLQIIESEFDFNTLHGKLSGLCSVRKSTII